MGETSLQVSLVSKISLTFLGLNLILAHLALKTRKENQYKYSVLSRERKACACEQIV